MMADVNRIQWITAQMITSFIHAFEKLPSVGKMLHGANVKTKFKIVLFYIGA